MKCKGDLPGLMSIREDLIKNKEKFWDQREKELESRRLQKQSDGAGEEVLTRKDLKKLTKQAKAKSRIRAQGRRNESAAPESSAAVSEASGREALDGQGAQKVDKDGEFLQDERDLNRRRTTDLQPGEFRIIHQGKVDLSELFGQNSTLPMEKAVPENLRVEIHLGSTVTSSSDIDVSISDDNKTLTVGQKSDPSAVHVVPLPHAVDVSKGRAQFFREKHHLHLVLPVRKSAFLPVFAENNRESKGEKTESSGEAGAPVESEHRENAQSLFWAEEKTKPGKNQERIQGGGALCGASTESPDAGGCLDGEDKHAVDQTLETPRENAKEEEALLSSSSPKPQHCQEKEGWGGCEAAQKRCGSLESERASDACNRAFDGDELSSAAFPGGQRGAETALLCEKSSDRERLSDFETRETGANACEEETSHVWSEETGTTSEEERRKTDGEFLEVVEPEFCRIARRDSARSPSDSEEQHNVEDAECLLDAEGCPDLEETVLTSEGASGFPQEQTHAVSLEKLEIRSPLLIGAESREAEERADEGDSERISFVDCGHVFVAPSEEDREENEKTLGLPGSPSRNKAQEVNANSAEQERIEETHDCEKQKLEDPEVVETRQNLLLRFRLPPGFMPYAHRTSKVEVTDSRKVSFLLCVHHLALLHKRRPKPHKSGVLERTQSLSRVRGSQVLTMCQSSAFFSS
ncbi:pre-RNA processing PIH1/Nop17 protein [Toxoplasma gondii VAND]|uniref:Pre-RNA processing PIH1/Nop17 protein n=1 Tax=Toxoplasma gondii VAND TaxID=933077 RepID=A0A086QHD8_TOXGO|nr:pre-RNA processing PIH1/Nop17 protein [Toxoplasma gondii VAND]